MHWEIKYLKSVQKEVRKIPQIDQKKIRAYLETKIAQADNPKSFGKALKGAHSEFWRYRVGQYRVICEISEREVTVLVVRIGHRKDVYRSKLKP